MSVRPFHFGLWRAVADWLGKRHDRSQLAPTYTEPARAKHSETTYYGGRIGDRIKGCLHREDGTRALYSDTVTGKVPIGFDVVEAVLRNRDVHFRRAKRTRPQRRETLPSRGQQISHSNPSSKPSVR